MHGEPDCWMLNTFLDTWFSQMTGYAGADRIEWSDGARRPLAVSGITPSVQIFHWRMALDGTFSARWSRCESCFWVRTTRNGWVEVYECRLAIALTPHARTKAHLDTSKQTLQINRDISRRNAAAEQS
jgi:hypothetical protein